MSKLVNEPDERLDEFRLEFHAEVTDIVIVRWSWRTGTNYHTMWFKLLAREHDRARGVQNLNLSHGLGGGGGGLRGSLNP